MTTPVLSLTGRLLCAAQQTYAINVSGAAPASPPTPTPTPSSLIGWNGVPQCSVAGDDGISAVMVGETDTEIIVAYRGTEPFDSLDHERMVIDWIDNFLDPLVASPNVAGSVHAGFSHAVDELWAWTLATVKALPPKALWLTGHSKGGALANIAAVKLVVAGLTPFVCTFEAARAGDPAFAAGYAQLVTHATRYEYQDDIVPLLPPTDGLLAYVSQLPFLAWLLSASIPSYAPVGDLRFINWQNQIVGDSPVLQAQRTAHLMAELDSLNCGRVIDDHSIAPGSGAAAVICGPIWPPAPPTVAAAAAGVLGAGAGSAIGV
jgi:hypothetical protein